jgi:simple sugar transport system ATP-binding protein
MLKSYRGPQGSWGQLLRLRRMRENAVELIRRHGIAAPGPATPARLLSGGNLQKVVLAREFSGGPRLLVAASPTRGLDVGAIETVHAYLRDAAADGVAVLLISEDLDEILTLADRIAVMYEGTIVGETTRAAASVEELGLLMAGGRDPRAD